MPTFVTICRGNRLSDSRLLAVSTDRQIIKKIAEMMAGAEEAKRPSESQHLRKRSGLSPSAPGRFNG